MATTLPGYKDAPTNPAPVGQEAKYVRLADIDGLLDHTSGWVNVKSYGATGDGTTDDTAAIQSAIAAASATGGTVLFPGASSTYLYTGTLTLPDGVWLTGSGVGASDSAKAPQIKINAGANPAVRVESGPVHIDHLRITNNGGTGVGIRATRQIVMRNVVVSSFVKTNLLLEQDAGSVGPYYSLISDSSFTYSDEHGAVVGNGANGVSFIGCRFFWNGFVNHNVGGGVGASNHMDGLYVGHSYNPNSVPASDPQSLTVIGGDAAYNSRYGWNFEDLVRSSAVQPAYGELNHSFGTGGSEYQYQARVGNGLHASFVSFGVIAPTALKLDAAFYRSTNPSTVMSGGTIVPQARDNGDATGYYALNGVVAKGITLPRSYLHTDDTSIHQRYIDSTFPSSGTWALGDIVWNSSSSNGAPLGWVCTSAGTPGTWRAFAPAGLYRNVSAITYSASMTPDATLADAFSITATNGTAFTVNAPTGAIAGQRVRIWIINTSGGALGTATWSGYKLGAAWVQPANGFRRAIDFETFGGNWYESGRSDADVAN